MAVTTAAIIGATAAAGGLALAVKSQSDAKKAAAKAQEAAAGAKVDVGAVSQQATDQALKNIALSRATELANNPENAALRTGSAQNLISQLGDNKVSDGLKALIASQLAKGGNSTFAGGVPVPNTSTFAGATDSFAGGANSDLLNAAISRAQGDLALGGNLPLDVRNLVARNAAAQGGWLGNIRLGRDINARDLGLTSLQIAQQRLQNAQGLGQAQLGANQFNTQQRQQATQFGQNLQQGASQFDANLANNANQFNSGQRQQANQFDQGYLLNQAQLLQSLSSGDFAKALAAAQFGQSIQAPVVGLDPSAIANLAVGNQNAGTAAGQTAAQIAASQAQGLGQFGGALTGVGLGALNYAATRQQQPVIQPYTPFQAPATNTAGYLAQQAFR